MKLEQNNHHDILQNIPVPPTLLPLRPSSLNVALPEPTLTEALSPFARSRNLSRPDVPPIVGAANFDERDLKSSKPEALSKCTECKKRVKDLRYCLLAETIECKGLTYLQAPYATTQPGRSKEAQVRSL